MVSAARPTRLLGLLSLCSCVATVAAVAAAAAPKGNVAVIGAGFSGLTAACELQKLGYHVTVFEKHTEVGGRARIFSEKGFVFDMGPSWYWMPGIFEHIFARYNRTVGEFYNLTLLDPAYRVELPSGQTVDVPGTYGGLLDFAEARGDHKTRMHLELFFSEAKEKFDKGVYDFIWKPMVSVVELLDLELMRAGLGLDMFSGFAQHLAQYTPDKLIHMLLKWPVIFIGASPDDAASMYSLMTYAGHVEGTWYPDGGLAAPALALGAIARDLGVEFRLGDAVTALRMGGAEDSDTVSAVCTESAGCTAVDAVLAAADYHYVEQTLLPPRMRHYDAAFWERQVMSPATMLFYLGFNQPLPGLLHHTFFFEEDLDTHLDSVFSPEPPRGQFADKPTFYVSATSKTDPGVLTPGSEAAGGEAVFVLVPVHPRLNGTDSEEERAKALDLVLDRMQARMDGKCRDARDGAKSEACPVPRLRDCLVYKRSYGMSDFEKDHHAFRGNAFGLANTLLQSLVLKPTLDAKPANMMFAGHLTNPGPGVPPAMVSGVVAANALDAKLQRGPASKTSWSWAWAAVVAQVQGVVFYFWYASGGQLMLAALVLLAFVLFVAVRVGLVASALGFAWLVPCRDRSTLSLSDSVLRVRSYFLCAELIYRHGRTYFAAACLMKPRTFFDTGACYAIFRVADDFVDNDDARMRAQEVDPRTGRIDPALFSEGALSRRAALKAFMADFWKCWNAAKAGKPLSLQDMYALHPIFPAVVESGIGCEFGDDLFERFFVSMLMDTQVETALTVEEVARLSKADREGETSSTKYVYLGKVCQSREDIFAYMDGSAAVIGDFMVPLLIELPADDGTAETRAKREAVLARRARALPHARNLGNAFQITNFTRDIYEDTDIARQYIPTDVCAKHGISGVVLKSESVDNKRYVAYPLSTESHRGQPKGNPSAMPGFVPLLEHMMQLAEELYEDSDKGIAMLPEETGPLIDVARRAYSAIHAQIRAGDYAIYDKRFRVPFKGKMKIASTIVNSAQVFKIVSVEFSAYAVFNTRCLVQWLARLWDKYMVPVAVLTALLVLTSPAASIASVSAPPGTWDARLWALLCSTFGIDTVVRANPAVANSAVAQVLTRCTYLQFHQAFTLPACALAWGVAARRAYSGEGSAQLQARCRALFRATVFWVAVLCVVATAYTLPWDNYLVANKVWWYGASRVHVAWLVYNTPAEEVAFFSIQTLFIGAVWLLWFSPTEGDHAYSDGLQPPRNLPAAEVHAMSRTRRAGYAFLLFLQLFGFALLDGLCGSYGTYGGLILSWCTPVLAVQWTFGAEALRDNLRPVAEVTAFSTFFLAALDRWAIRNGIWAISEQQAAPRWVAAALLGENLPLEEALFFKIASSMCCGGLTLAVMASLDSKRCGGFYKALVGAHTWGCHAGAKDVSQEACNLRKRAASLSKRRMATSAALWFASAGVPLASVAHFPAHVASVLYAVFGVMLARPAAVQATISAVDVLKSARVFHVLVSVFAVVYYLRSLERAEYYRALLGMALGNIFFGMAPRLFFKIN